MLRAQEQVSEKFLRPRLHSALESVYGWLACGVSVTERVRARANPPGLRKPKDEHSMRGMAHEFTAPRTACQALRAGDSSNPIRRGRGALGVVNSLIALIKSRITESWVSR